MAGLFGKNKLKSMAQKVATDDVMPFIEIVKTWHNDYHQGTLKTDKETSREQSYNRDFFITILGYAEKPANPWSFEPKATTEKGQLPDAVISYNGENISAVVELKGASIPLDRPQQREGNMSPVQQGFKYKTQYRRCPFVIVSNFYEFRLYQDNQLDYEVWTLDDLTNPDDDFISFKSWYILLKAVNFVAKTGISKTESMLSELLIEKEAICNKFYQQYKSARLELLREIWKKNKAIRNNIDFVINKAQKITDRLVFVFFAEDRGLLPDNTLQKVIASAENSAFGGSVWDMFKAFFNAIDTGSGKLEIPDGYNGGLFKSDAELNNLIIGDEALLNIAELGKFDFIDDLSVEILGHIFEQSISDLEEIKAKVKDGDDLKELAISRRKKDGIFYTPGYIVRYIVDNSLGAYLREHEDKFKNEFGLKEDILDENYAKREHEAYLRYQAFLQDVKVLDPACGSGAFLVYVFDYLLAENKRVNDILDNHTIGTIYGSEDNVKNILKNNIYGVDINAESVEITKLSLWLKTAQKGKHLTTMDGNIKCGNSLIDDPGVTGNKAFDWQKEFPEIFAHGGFDVVVGNPPYGAKLTKSQIDHLVKLYSNWGISNALNDTYFAFYALSLSYLLKPFGYLSFIAPNTWKLIATAKMFRDELLSKYRVIQIVEHTNKVFSDATVDVDTLVIKKINKGNNVHVRIVRDDEIIYEHSIEQSILANQDFINPRLTKSDYALKDKVFKQSDLVMDTLTIKNGVKPYEKGKGKPAQTEQTMKDKPFTSEVRDDDSFLPLVGGSYFQRYKLLWRENYWIKYGEWLAAPREPGIFEAKEKLIFRQTGDSIIGTLIGGGIILRDNTHILLNKENSPYYLKYVLAVLNSKLVDWYYWTINPEKGEAMAQVKLFHLGLLPIKRCTSSEQGLFVALVDKMLMLNTDLLNLNYHFTVLLSSELDKLKISANWYTLDFPDFVKALKVKLTLIQKDDLLNLWNRYQPQLVALNEEITAIDKEIDRKVYELYGLTPEEIAIVEGV